MIEAIEPIVHNALLCSKAVIKISSLDQKPANGNIPAIANVEINMVANVIGIALRKPPILRMSCSPCNA